MPHHDSGWKNGDALTRKHTHEMFTYYIRIPLPNGDFLSESVNCSANDPPNLLEVLKSNCEKFSKIHPSRTGDIYGYLKLYSQQWDKYVDFHRALCGIRVVRHKDKFELWYSHEKKHSNAVLMTVKHEPMEMEDVPVVPEIHLQIKDNNVMVEKDVPLNPDVQQPKNGDTLAAEHTPEMLVYYIRIPLLNGEFLSESVFCSANNPLKLLEVLESNCEKFSKIHPTRTSNIYGYLKRYDQHWGEYVDLEPTFYPHTPVRPNDKIELWYSLLKQHPNAVLLKPMKEEQDPAPVVPEFHLQIFKDNNFMVEQDVPLKPGVQQSITELIKHIGAQCNVVTGSRLPRKMFGWIMKNEGQNNYVEVNLDDKLEGGAAYQLHFVEFDSMIKGDLKAYFVLSNCEDVDGELKLVRVPKQRNKRQDNLSKCKHEEIPKEVTPVKSCVFLRVFMYDGVAEDIFSFERNVPQSFHKVISYLDEKHNLVVKDDRFVIFAWILKVTDENVYTEVDMNGVVEEGMKYHVRFVSNQYVIKDDVSAYLKIKCSAPGNKKLDFQLIQRESAKKKATATSLDRIRGADEDPAKLKREEISKVESVAPAESCIFLRVYKDQRVVVDSTVTFDPSTPPTFQYLVEQIDAHYNVFAESDLYRQIIYACIFKVGSERKLEVDLSGVIEGAVTYHVYFAQLMHEIEDGVSAIFKISYGGHENKKHEFEVIKRGSACDKKLINDCVSEKCEQFSKKEDQAALPAKRQIYVQVFKNEKYLLNGSMPITCSPNDCPSFQSLISALNRKWKIFTIYGRYAFVWILKDMGENHYNAVDLNGVVEEGATYRVHFATFIGHLMKDLRVTAYFKISYLGNEGIEFEYLVRPNLRAKKCVEALSGRRMSREEHVPSKKHEDSCRNIPQPSHVQPEEVVIPYSSGEFEKILKTLNVEEGKPRELPTILQDMALPSKITTSDTPKAITMVLLGETGVGKSTLINGMVNYIVYGSLSEAESNRPKFLIPARFLYDGKKILIGEQTANENIQLDGELATQRPKVYEFTENEQLFRIIDVPGIGDSRGVEQDRKNFDYILEEINRHEEINAFCILTPPNGSRITVAMRYCIYELLSNLHKDAARNIVFCFTKARSTFYKGGDTLPILRDYLKNLKRQQDVEIALDEDQNMFYFDNEPFKYLWLKENGINLDHQRKEYDRSFNVSRESTVKLFEYVRNLPPHDTTAMKALTETRRLILNMVPISAAASKKIRMNKSSLEDQIEQLRCSRYQTKSLQEHLYMKMYTIETTPLEKPRTVCASERCVEKVPIGDGKSGRFNVLYKQICHDPCYLESVTPGKYPDSAMRGCRAFEDGSHGKCIECGCSWESHQHIKHLQEIVEEKSMNRELQKMLATKDNQHLSIADVIRSYEVQLAQMKDDEELIKKMSAKFSTFLRNNSMSIRNDVYADYLKHTLKMAEQELAVGGCYKKVAELRQSLQAYEQEIEFLVKAENSSGPVTIEDIFELKKELRALAERHGEIGDMLNIAEEETMTVEPPQVAKSPEKPEPTPREAKEPESRSAEDSSKKSKKKSKGGGKTYNKSMLKDFM